MLRRSKRIAALLLSLLLLTAAAFGEAPDGPETGMMDDGEEMETGGDEEIGTGDPDQPGNQEPAAPVLTLRVDGGTRDEAGVWHAEPDPEGALVFRWSVTGGADFYTAVLEGPRGEAARAEQTVGTSLRVKAGDLTPGDYLLSVTAFRNGEAAAEAVLRLVLTEAEDGIMLVDDEDEPAPTVTPAPDGGDDPAATDEPEPTATRRPGGGYSGSWRRVGGRTATGESGRITPGVALTTSHAKGSGDLTAHGTVPLTVTGEAEEILYLGGEELAVSAAGSLFTAEIRGDVLALTAETGNEWRFTGLALDTMARSGVRLLVLTGADGSEYRIGTDLALTGPAYGRERAKGLVSADFLFAVSEGEWTVTVEDRVYRLNGTELEKAG